MSEILELVLRAERPRRALVSRAARAADAVDVGFGHLRQFVVDHQRQLVDVDAAGGDVGGSSPGTRPT